MVGTALLEPDLQSTSLEAKGIVCSLLYYHLTNGTTADPKEASRSKSFEVIYQKPPTQAHTLFRFLNLTSSTKTKTESTNLESIFSFTTFESKIMEECHLPKLDPYTSSSRAHNSSSLSLQNLWSFQGLFSQAKKSMSQVYCEHIFEMNGPRSHLGSPWTMWTMSSFSLSSMSA